MKFAVVGHVEWIEFARVDRVPAPGEIVHTHESWQEPGGGGAVTAVQLARLAGEAVFFTSLGDDEVGHRCLAGLEALGLSVQVAWRDEPQRRGFVFVDAEGERTITVIGNRLGPSGDDRLEWGLLEGAAAVYFTAGDADALRCARGASQLVATARVMPTLVQAGVGLDALVASGADEGELYRRGQISPEPGVVVRTAGARGGVWEAAGGATGAYDAAPLPGSVSDAYGCGDSFAGGVTYGLGAGLGLAQGLRIGARCGAACLTGRGPYSGQITAATLAG